MKGNLLLNAANAGVELIITKAILDELVGHIEHTIRVYNEEYRGREAVYADAEAILYVQEILIRSYFYALLDGRQLTFDAFIETFVTPGARTIRGELIEWLSGTFGIEYVDERALGVRVREDELNRLTD